LGLTQAGANAIENVYAVPLGGNGTFTKQYYTIVDSTTTTVSSSANPSTYGDSVTFTATVTDTRRAANPTGTVQFYDRATLLGSGPALVNSGSNAATSTFTTTALSAGDHSNITAVYTATTGSSFVSSTSAAFDQVVNKAHLTVTADNKSK